MAEVERFMGPISSSLRPEADGQWVRASDYEQVAAQRDKAIAERDVLVAAAKQLPGAKPFDALMALVAQIERGQ